MEVVWNVCAAVIIFWLKRSVDLHDMLHGFRMGRVTGTATLQVKLAQQMAGLAREPLFQVFWGIIRAFNSLDRGRCMEILRGYGIGLNMARLLSHHWDNQHIVPKTGRFLGKAFSTEKGVT